MGLAEGQKAISFSVFWEFESCLGQEFKFFLQAANQLPGGEKKCIVYSLFCILIIIVIIIISSSSIISSSISFVSLLNYLYLHP